MGTGVGCGLVSHFYICQLYIRRMGGAGLGSDDGGGVKVVGEWSGVECSGVE